MINYSGQAEDMAELTNGESLLYYTLHHIIPVRLNNDGEEEKALALAQGSCQPPILHSRRK